MKISKLLLFFFSFFIISCNNNSTEEILRKTSNSMNKNCPQIIDKYTTLNNITTYGKNFIYNYYIDVSMFNDFKISKNDWTEEQELILTNFYCTDPKFVFFKEKNVNVTWSYIDLNGSSIGEIKLNQSSCK